MSVTDCLNLPMISLSLFIFASSISFSSSESIPESSSESSEEDVKLLLSWDASSYLEDLFMAPPLPPSDSLIIAWLLSCTSTGLFGRFYSNLVVIGAFLEISLSCFSFCPFCDSWSNFYTSNGYSTNEICWCAFLTSWSKSLGVLCECIELIFGS